MNSDNSSLEAASDGSSSSRSHLSRAAAIIEVLSAFAIVHVLYRALKEFTTIGQWETAAGYNFSPGIVMILATLVLLRVHRKNFRDYGMSPLHWRDDLTLALKWAFLLTAAALIVVLCGVRGRLSGDRPSSMTDGAVVFAGKLVMTVVFAYVYRRQLPTVSRARGVLGVTILVAVCCSPLLVALVRDKSLVHTLLTALWVGFTAAIGEEMFFRGYIQSRVNEAFGRPWTVLGVQFGLGLFVSALLFAFVHSLNSVNYFRGQFTFTWSFALLGFFSVVVRERTGRIWAGMGIHAILNILGYAAALAAGAV